MTDKKNVLKDSEMEKVSAGKGYSVGYNALEQEDIKGIKPTIDLNFARNSKGEPGCKY